MDVIIAAGIALVSSLYFPVITTRNWIPALVLGNDQKLSMVADLNEPDGGKSYGCL